MYAVVRETTFAPDEPIYESPAFQQFQREHASLPGYQGTVVVDVGGGRFVTLTLWRTAEDMSAAREVMGPVAERVLNSLMTAPSRLYGTGPVVVNDLVQLRQDTE